MPFSSLFFLHFPMEEKNSYTKKRNIRKFNNFLMQSPSVSQQKMTLYKKEILIIKLNFLIYSQVFTCNIYHNE